MRPESYDLANGLTALSSGHWNKNVNPCWGITSSFDTVMRQLDIANIDLLPNLSFSPPLILTSDYGGQHKGATHETFSFLAASVITLKPAIRYHFKTGHRGGPKT